MVLDDEQRLHLQKMIDANDVVDNTGNIKELKHSAKIRKDVETLEQLKKKHQNIYLNNREKFEEISISACNFLFYNYTDIYNKLLKDELNISILNQFLDVLKKIEDGHVDQHEGSVLIGELLKKIYIDSALRRADKLDNEHGEKRIIKEPKEISWRKYKLQKSVSQI